MENHVNTASWRYKMMQIPPKCCVTIASLQNGNTSFWAFNNYVSKNNLDRNKILGFLNPVSSHTLPDWIVEGRTHNP